MKSTTTRYQVSQPASTLQGKGANMSELRTCAESVGGLAVMTLPQARNQGVAGRAKSP